MLDQDSFSLVELFVQDSKFSLDSKVINTFLSDKFVQLSEVVGTGHVTEGSVASLSNI